MSSTDPTPMPLEPPQKRKQHVKPLPDLIQGLTLGSIKNFEVTAHRELFKDDQTGEEREADLAIAIQQGEETVDLKKLTLDQLRKLAINLSVKKSNLTKQQVRFWIAESAKTVGALKEATSVQWRQASTACRVINAIFHRSNIDEFLTFNNSRSRATHETGSGGLFERFWGRIVTWVNSDVVVCDMENDDNSSLLGAEEDQVFADIGQLWTNDNSDPEDPYNNHVRIAISDGVDPSPGNISFVNTKDVQKLILDLNKVRKEINKCMDESGTHSSDPMDFAVAGIRRAGVSRIDRFTAYYFYMCSKDVPSFDFHFCTGLDASLSMEVGGLTNRKQGQQLHSDSSDLSDSKPRSRRASPTTTEQTKLFINAINQINNATLGDSSANLSEA